MKKATTLVLFGALSLATTAISALIGIEWIPVASLFDNSSADWHIFWDHRAPRVCTAFIAGAALSVSGMAFQAMFRNALATPYTLGVASGASLGAAIAVRLGLTLSVLGIPTETLAAFAGALGSILLVNGLTWGRRGVTSEAMLLAGIAVNFFFISLILFIQHTSDPTSAARLTRWLVGGQLALARFKEIVEALPFVATGGAVLILLTHELNLLTTGDDIAASRGVAVERVKKMLFVSTSLMVGGVVAICGPIGFVGLMAPHIARLLIGPDHRYLLPASALFGGAFLCICDMFTRWAFAPAELPVGVVTAFLGGPFFLALLLGRRSGSAS